MGRPTWTPRRVCGDREKIRNGSGRDHRIYTIVDHGESQRDERTLGCINVTNTEREGETGSASAKSFGFFPSLPLGRKYDNNFAEMDKSMKRQMKKLSGRHMKLLSGVDGDVKVKKQKLRKLSVVDSGRENSKEDKCEMGCLGFDVEDELRSKAPSPSTADGCKRFKIPRKCFDDCSPVNHASVPRRLRSAMKKRNCDSVSAPLPDSKKPNHTINTKQSISGPITKDEEEVAETLYALAGMFPDNDTIKKIKLDGESSELRSSTMLDARLSPNNEASIERSHTLCQSTSGNAVDGSSSKEEVPQEIGTVDSSTRECNMGLVSSIPEVEPQTPGECKIGPIDQKHICKSQFGPSLEIHLKHPSLPERKPEISLEPVNAIGSQQHEQQHTANEKVKNEPALRCCAYSTQLLASENYGPSQSSRAKIPTWLDSASDFSAKKVSGVTVETRHPRKRCATHVYITHLIQDLQNPKMKERSRVQLNPLRPNVGQQPEIFMVGNDLNRPRNSLNGVVSSSKENPIEATLLHKRLHPDEQQSYEFLSLSPGSGISEANSSTSRMVNCLEPLTQLHIPYLQSLAQHPTVVPLSFPQQLQQQQPSFPFCGTPPNVDPATSSTNQLQQQIWAAQMAAQYRPGGMPSSHILNWQNGGRHDSSSSSSSSSLIQCAQHIFPPPPSSLESLNPKYGPLTLQQQPQFYALTSPFPPPKEKRRQHLSPPGYEGNGGALPLQLLCTERL